MSDLNSDQSVGTGNSLTQFSSLCCPSEPKMSPPGKYVCIECGDASIVWHTAVDEYKTKCPKCNVQMVRVKQDPVINVKV
ncbi:hypothetical protein LCGC14_2146010 [marine sediment metagenome]|uniref:Uncharacterized protein n=1 Tax=marine sediment metagenome TaxID=412755 RepID=A0A0F9G9U7_9ZZZZ